MQRGGLTKGLVSPIKGKKSNIENYGTFEGLKSSIPKEQRREAKVGSSKSKNKFELRLIQLIIQKGFCVEFMRAEKKLSGLDLSKFKNFTSEKRQKFNLKLFSRTNPDSSTETYKSFELHCEPLDFFSYMLTMPQKDRNLYDKKTTKFKILAKNLKSSTSYYLIHQQTQANIFKKGKEMVYVQGVKEISDNLYFTIKFSVELGELLPKMSNFERIELCGGYGIITKDPMTGYCRFEEYSKFSGREFEEAELIKSLKRTKEIGRLEAASKGYERWMEKQKAWESDEDDRRTAAEE
jgi:hypothetical protein